MGRDKLVDRTSLSDDTIARADAELVAKGLMELLPIKRGRRKVYRLLRPQLAERRPHLAVASPQPAEHIEEVRTPESGLQPLSPESQEEAAASPRPARARKAAAKKKSRTGWRFVGTLQGGRYVEDPEGTDRPPRGYFDEPARTNLASEREPVDALEPVSDEDRHARLLDMHELIVRLSGDGGGERGEQLGDGPCGDCHRTAMIRERFGGFELCLPCVRRRIAVAARVASHVAQAGDPA